MPIALAYRMWYTSQSQLRLEPGANEMMSTVEGPLPVRTLALQPLNANVSFRDQSYTALKQAIMDADIYAHPDEIRLDERQLSSVLGVSRTPIREAMTLLEQEGFLRTLPRRGVFIVRKTKKQIIEMIEVWAALESMAARLATLNATDVDIGALRHMFDEFHAVTPDQQVRRHAQVTDLVEIGVRRQRQCIGKQTVDPWTTEFTGRQAYAVDYDEVCRHTGRPVVAVGRRHLPRE